MRKIVLIAIAILLVACTDDQPAGIDSTSTQGKPVVMASNYPLYFFTREIAGENIEVSFPTIEGVARRIVSWPALPGRNRCRRLHS